MKKLAVVLIAVALVAIVAPLAMAENDTCINMTVVQIPNPYAERGMSCVQQSDVEYPQEYYDLKTLADDHVTTGFTWDAQNTQYLGNIFYELRRQTTLMERQNKLLAEQNELMRKQQKMSLVCVSGTMAKCDRFQWREL